MTQMLFQQVFEDYEGENYSHLIEDEWNEIELEFIEEENVYLFI